MGTDIDVMQELDLAGAILLDRHFVYKSGKHGSGYINMDMIFPNVRVTGELCSSLIDPFLGTVDTIAAPAVGGIALSILAAHSANLSDRSSVRAVWADKDGDTFAFERAGFIGHLTGKRVLIVEDLLTTGGSVMSVIAEARKHGADIIGVSVICNRGGLTAEALDVPRLEALANVSFEAIDADKCPLCRDEVPIVEDIGHGANYKAEHPDYPGGYVASLV